MGVHEEEQQEEVGGDHAGKVIRAEGQEMARAVATTQQRERHTTPRLNVQLWGTKHSLAGTMPRDVALPHRVRRWGKTVG